MIFIIILMRMFMINIMSTMTLMMMFMVHKSIDCLLSIGMVIGSAAERCC